MKTFIAILLLLVATSPVLSQMRLARDADGKTVKSKGYVAPQSRSALPLEWRWAFISLDAMNGFKDKFSRINYGVSSSAVLGYKNYSFRAEVIAPLSAQGWLIVYDLNIKFFDE